MSSPLDLMALFYSCFGIILVLPLSLYLWIYTMQEHYQLPGCIPFLGVWSAIIHQRIRLSLSQPMTTWITIGWLTDPNREVTGSCSTTLILRHCDPYMVGYIMWLYGGRVDRVGSQLSRGLVSSPISTVTVNCRRTDGLTDGWID